MSARTTWIVLFRGVGGKTQLPVKPLREKLAEAGYEDVATYINSGNAIVTTRKSRDTTTKEIAAICSREFGFDKDIHLRSAREWRELIDSNPFPEAVDAPKFLRSFVSMPISTEPKLRADFFRYSKRAMSSSGPSRSRNARSAPGRCGKRKTKYFFSPSKRS